MIFLQQRFNESGAVIKRGAFGLGESYDKNFKCRDRFHVCCRKPFCNKDTTAPCPPPGKFPQFNIVRMSILSSSTIAKITTKKEVKACYQCKGQEACKPEKLTGSEIRTSGAFGGKNLYCYTVSFTGLYDRSSFTLFRLQKFDPASGAAVARGGFGFGEALDKNLKCDAKHYLCCYENLCNNQTAGFCVKPKKTAQN